MSAKPAEPAFLPLRVMTYNVHACKGRDGVISPRRIAAVIAAAAPDVVALQELDVGRVRSGKLDQAELIARELGMRFHFSPAMRVLEEAYGDAILTALPMRLVKTGALPAIRFPVRLEPRGALWTDIAVGQVRLQMLVTHLGLVRRERRLQADALCGAEWLGHRDCGRPAILAGDFNFLSRSRAYAQITSHLQDVQRLVPRQRHDATFPARRPRFRIDYMFVSPGIRVDRVETIRTPATAIASDHLPLLADLQIPVEAAAVRQAPLQHAWAVDHA
jgi:endonuclease/exonuclease/phosphatase family metal-dependent hydrolase